MAKHGASSLLGATSARLADRFLLQSSSFSQTPCGVRCRLCRSRLHRCRRRRRRHRRCGRRHRRCGCRRHGVRHLGRAADGPGGLVLASPSPGTIAGASSTMWCRPSALVTPQRKVNIRAGLFWCRSEWLPCRGWFLAYLLRGVSMCVCGRRRLGHPFVGAARPG